MRVILCSPLELSGEHLRQWRKLLIPAHGWDSPFYEPTFLQRLAKYRPQLEVALFEENSCLECVFAYERTAGNRAMPPGVKLSDFQGPIFRETFQLSPHDVLRRCRLKAWEFDHQPLTERRWRSWSVRQSASRYVDLSSGYAEYESRQKEQTKQFTLTAKKLRKMEKELGPLEFQWHTGEAAPLQTLLEWKSAQRQRTNTLDVLAWDWVVEFLRDLQQTRTPELQGALSMLSVAGQPAALHLGLATPTAFHYWFPSYGQEHQKHSPGQILLIRLLEEIAARGIRRADFGKGEEPFKQSFATGAFELGEGVLDHNRLGRAIRGSAYQVWEWIRHSPLYGPANTVKRWFKKQRTGAAMNQAIPSENLTIES